MTTGLNGYTHTSQNNNLKKQQFKVSKKKSVKDLTWRSETINRIIILQMKRLTIKTRR